MSKKDIDIVKNIVIESLENLKTQDIVIIDVSKKSNFTDFLFIGTGTSSTHIKAIGSEVTENIKKNGYGRFIKGVESNGEWICLMKQEIFIALRNYGHQIVPIVQNLVLHRK